MALMTTEVCVVVFALEDAPDDLAGIICHGLAFLSVR